MRNHRFLAINGAIALAALLVAFGPRSIASGIASVISVFGQVGVVNIPVTTTDISTPAAPAASKTIWYTKGGKLCAEDPAAAETCTGSGGGGPTANENARGWGAGFDGGGAPLTVGLVAYAHIPYACTINGYAITATAGTISFDVWKLADGTAIPTVANSILTGGFLALTTGTAFHSTSTTLFTSTAVAGFDVYAVEIQAVTGSPTSASLQVGCVATP